jgi:hypothetical protein
MCSTDTHSKQNVEAEKYAPPSIVAHAILFTLQALPSIACSAYSLSQCLEYYSKVHTNFLRCPSEETSCEDGTLRSLRLSESSFCLLLLLLCIMTGASQQSECITCSMVSQWLKIFDSRRQKILRRM